MRHVIEGWWRHQMETFSALRPVTRSFNVFFHLRPNKRLSKPSWGWWFETPSRSLWLHCNCPVDIWHYLWQIVFVCLYITPYQHHHCHCANLFDASEICFVECVSKIKHILSVIHYTIYGAVCLQFTHFPCDDWGNIYTLSHYHQQIGSMNCKSLFRSWPWNNGIRCMSLYIVILIWHTNPIDLSTFETRPNDLTNKSIFLRSNSQFWCHHFMFWQKCIMRHLIEVLSE